VSDYLAEAECARAEVNRLRLELAATKRELWWARCVALNRALDCWGERCRLEYRHNDDVRGSELLMHWLARLEEAEP